MSLAKSFFLNHTNFGKFRVHLIHVFKNKKLLFKNICENTCRWKNMLKYINYHLKTENGWLKTQTKHPLNSITNVKDAWARDVRPTLPLHAIINVTFSCQALFYFIFFSENKMKWWNHCNIYMSDPDPYMSTVSWYICWFWISIYDGKMSGVGNILAF